MIISAVEWNGAEIGAGIVLKVMAGDSFYVRASSWWSSTNSPDPAFSPLTDILSLLNAGVSGVSAGHYTATQLNSNSALNPGISSFLTSHSTYNTSLPKAF